jgi:hypothetical protein
MSLNLFEGQPPGQPAIRFGLYLGVHKIVRQSP